MHLEQFLFCFNHIAEKKTTLVNDCCVSRQANPVNLQIEICLIISKESKIKLINIIQNHRRITVIHQRHYMIRWNCSAFRHFTDQNGPKVGGDHMKMNYDYFQIQK